MLNQNYGSQLTCSRGLGLLLVRAAPMCIIACTSDIPASEKPTWDEGVYHVEVDLDTADPLSDSDNGDTSTVGTIADVVSNRLFLQVRQIDRLENCSGSQPLSVFLIEDMQAWVGDWYADLLLPTGFTCFDIDASATAAEVGLDSAFDTIDCNAMNDEPVQSSGGEVVSINLTVTCAWYGERDCESCN